MRSSKQFAPRAVMAIIFAAGVIACVPAVGVAQGETSNIDPMVARINSDPANPARYREAYELSLRISQIVDEGQGESIGDDTIAALIDLLKDGNEAGDFWIVGALSQIGPRAKRAVPVLLELHPKACDELRAQPFSSGVHYVDGIEWALKRLTGSAPDCRGLGVQRFQ